MTDALRPAALRLDHIAKSFGNVRAVRDVSLELHAGSVLALMGENGAGKSTIISMIIGRLTPDAGTIEVGGRPQFSYGPAQARKLGIRAVLQDFSLVPSMSVESNMFLNNEILSPTGLLSVGRMTAVSRERLSRVGAAHIDPSSEVSQLSRAEQQLVEIAKAVDGPPGVLLLDEPTASISETETARLFDLVDQLKLDGWAILYISHRMNELRRVADDVTVIRDGAWVSTSRFADTTSDQIVADMVGREVAHLYPERSTTPGAAVLDIVGLSTRDGRVRDVDLDVRAGEIVGVGGLVGCGKREVANVFFGLAELSFGTVTVSGTPYTRPTARRSARRGVGFIPEDRKREANLTGRSVEDNICVEVMAQPRFSPGGMLRKSRLKAFATRFADELDIRPRDTQAAIESLSGGNQQKTVLARALTKPRDLFILVEPTAGVDVGARADIYLTISALAEDGAGVLLVSSDVEELVGLSDRAYVMHEGAITADLRNNELTVGSVVAAAFGDAPVTTEGFSG